jgi:ribonuclease HII
VAGVDEAGRGPLAGPVVAAAVILDDLQPIRGLADSKVLTAARASACTTRSAPRRCAVSIAEASVEEIDRLNILQATMLAMQRAVEGLRLVPQRCWWTATACRCCRCRAAAIVKGDARWRPSRPRRSWPRCTATGCAPSCTRAPALRLRRPQGLPHAEHLAALQRLGPARAPAQLRAGAGRAAPGWRRRMTASARATPRPR